MRRWIFVLLLSCHRPPAQPGDAAPSVVARPVVAPPAADEPELQVEEREEDPRSQTVKVKLVVTPQARGVVMWGRKKLGDLGPGKMTLELERPRNSGPLDVLIRAEGFVPHQVRLFTDRDDRLNVRLYRPTEASGLLGYRRSAAPLPP